MSSAQIHEIVAILGVLSIMLGLTYLRHFGLIHFKKFWQECKRLYLEILIVAKLRRMDTNETIMLKDFISQYQVDHAEQKAFNKTILEEVHTISRGIYGDRVNGVPGLIQRQTSDEERIAGLENDVKEIKGSMKSFRNKLIWTGSGFLVGLQSIWEFIKWKSK